MMIDDLNNDMLREILCRLPCYRTALCYKAVSKRWCSVISDPLFVTQGFLTHRRKIIEKEPSFIFLLTTKEWDDNNYATAMAAPPCFQRTTLWSPILSLQFLPFHSKPAATFKDLILSFGVNPLTGLGMFYICNPLTKQWIVLPPSQMHQKEVIWAALTYLDGHGFRVVVAHSQPYPSHFTDPFITINLLMYISETCQWRNIDVTLQLEPFNDGYYDHNCCFTGVVCKGVVCIQYGKYFGALNPFDVTDTSHGTLTAIDLPSLNRKVNILLESDGKLIAFERDVICLRLNCERNLAYFSAQSRIWKLDMRHDNDKQLRQWELLLQHDDRLHVKGSMLTAPYFFMYNQSDHDFKVLGVHPGKEHLVYLRRPRGGRQTWLILFDTKSKTLERTKTIPSHDMHFTPPCLKLDIPSWPTPIPVP